MRRFITQYYYIGLLPLLPQKQKRVPFSESSRARARARGTKRRRPTSAPMPTSRTTRNKRSVATSVRVRASFACGCRRHSRALVGARQLRVRSRACSRFAYARGRAPGSRTRAAVTHVRVTHRYHRPSRGRNGCRGAYLKTDLHTTHTQRKHDHGAHDHEQGIQPNWS